MKLVDDLTGGIERLHTLVANGVGAIPSMFDHFKRSAGSPVAPSPDVGLDSDPSHTL